MNREMLEVPNFGYQRWLEKRNKFFETDKGKLLSKQLRELYDEKEREISKKRIEDILKNAPGKAFVFTSKGLKSL